MERNIPTRQRLVWVALTVLWTLVAVGVYYLAVRTSGGQQLDEELLQRWATHNRPVRHLAVMLRMFLPFVLLIVVFRLCVVVWWVRRSLVAVVAVVLGVTIVAAMALRDVLLTRPDMDYGDQNTLPSNHMAFTVALVGAVLFLRRAGSRWDGLVAGPARPDWHVAAVLVTVVVAEATVNVVTYAHRPADPLAAVAIVAALWSAALAVYGVPRWGTPVDMPELSTQAPAEPLRLPGEFR
ncbi:MAG: hypothetical protein FWF02_00020 [Micrococcales bacterium]|nr:hypothetical protein [Micrococcales bacterium]MCL2666084.1 hypothetical protein [Micrococcales bacterium]